MACICDTLYCTIFENVFKRNLITLQRHNVRDMFLEIQSFG